MGLEFASRSTSASALAWWLGVGLNTLVGNDPCDWLATPPPARAQPQPESQPAARAATPDLSRAEALARSAESPIELAAAHRKLFGPAAVFFEGDPANSLLLALSAPDPLAHARGELLYGDAALLLTSMLRVIGRSRETSCLVALAPTPAGSAATAAMVLPFVRRLADMVQPRVIVALGSDATTALLSMRSGVGRLRGQFAAFAGLSAEHPLLPTFHPALLVANPAQKAAAWADLLSVKAKLSA